MKKWFVLISFLVLIIACSKKKKYDPQEYEVTLETKDSSFEDVSVNKLRSNCLTFMNYCDANYTSDLRIFVRDWLRTYKNWESDGVKDFNHSLYCFVSNKQKFDRQSAAFHVYKETEPPSFRAELIFYRTEYDELVNMVMKEFGQPNSEKKVQSGIAYIWKRSNGKSISTFQDKLSVEFVLEYQLNSNWEP